MTDWLIVVGPHRGELRFRDCAVDAPFVPITDSRGNPHTFATWYLDWLAQREAWAEIRAVAGNKPGHCRPG